MTQIVLFGATGYTGRLVAAELRRRGVTPRLAGRRREALEQLAALWSPAAPIQLASPDDPTSLRAMARGARAVINTVGPFLDFGLPVVAAALAEGAHYLDTTGEQRFMIDCIATFQHQAAAAKLAVLNAAAFEYALGTLAAAELLRRLGPIEQLDITYLFGNQGSSPGTRKSILRIASRSGLDYSAGRYVARRPLSLTRELQLRAGRRPIMTGWFPSGELINVPRLGKFSDVHAYVATSRAIVRLSRALAPLLPLLAIPRVERPLSRLLAGGGAGPERPMAGTAGQNPDGKPALIVLEASAPTGRLELSVPDPYGITATIVVEGAMRLLEGDPERAGVVSMAEAFDPAALLAVFERAGIGVS